MTVIVTPWAIDGNTHPAAEVRAALCAQLGGTFGSFVTALSTSDAAHGIAGPTDLKVSQNGTPNMSVNVAIGAAFVRSGEAASQTYFVRNDATVNLSIAAADPTNERRDLVILQVRDSNFSGSDDDARLFVVTGTPSGSPVDPSLASHPNALVLARVNVPALDTAITDAQIVDWRVAARGAAWFQARGRIGGAGTASIQSGITTVTDLTNLAATVPTLANRRYRIEAKINFRQISSSGLVALEIVRGTSTVLDTSHGTWAAGEYGTLNLTVDEVPGAGSTAYKLRARTTAGTLDVNSTATATILSTLDIWDVGGEVG